MKATMLGYLVLLLLALSSSVISEEVVYKNGFRPGENIYANLIIELRYKDGRLEKRTQQMGTFSYTSGSSSLMSTTLNVKDVELLSDANATLAFSKEGWHYGYKHGVADLVFSQPNSTAKRLLLRRSSTQDNDTKQTKPSLQWIPGINVFLSYDESQYKKLPRRYYPDKICTSDTIYSPDSSLTTLLEPQSNYISLDGSGEVDLPIRLNVTVIPAAEAWKIALKVGMLLESANHFSSNDLKDVQNVFFKVSPHYMKFLGVISVAHVVLTFLSVKNDVNTRRILNPVNLLLLFIFIIIFIFNRFRSGLI